MWIIVRISTIVDCQFRLAMSEKRVMVNIGVWIVARQTAHITIINLSRKYYFMVNLRMYHFLNWVESIAFSCKCCDQWLLKKNIMHCFGNSSIFFHSHQRNNRQWNQWLKPFGVRIQLLQDPLRIGDDDTLRISVWYIWHMSYRRLEGALMDHLWKAEKEVLNELIASLWFGTLDGNFQLH